MHLYIEFCISRGTGETGKYYVSKQINSNEAGTAVAQTYYGKGSSSGSNSGGYTQDVGSIMYASASSQLNDYGKARYYDKSIDLKWLFLPITSPSSKGELFMGAAKIFDFISGDIHVSSGVKLNNAPVIEEPDPKVVITYNTKNVKWTITNNGSTGEVIKGYDTIPDSDTDSVVRVRKKQGDSNFLKKELGGYFNEYKK